VIGLISAASSTRIVSATPFKDSSTAVIAKDEFVAWEAIEKRLELGVV
jgi:hypothetical protein